MVLDIIMEKVLNIIDKLNNKITQTYNTEHQPRPDFPSQ